MDMEMRGVADDSGFYLLKYSAPTLHYFARDLPAYENLTGTLRLADSPGNSG